jgi:hypothetical protein
MLRASQKQDAAAQPSVQVRPLVLSHTLLIPNDAAKPLGGSVAKPFQPNRCAASQCLTSAWVPGHDLLSLNNLTDCRLVNNRIVIPVDINGQTRHFLYDTGASLFPMVTTSTIWQAMAGEAVTDTLNIANFGNAVTLCGAMSALPVQIAGRPFGQFTVYHERDDYFDTVFKQIGCDGIIGNAFFLDKKICIDYHNQRFGIGH